MYWIQYVDALNMHSSPRTHLNTMALNLAAVNGTSWVVNAMQWMTDAVIHSSFSCLPEFYKASCLNHTVVSRIYFNRSSSNAVRHTHTWTSCCSIAKDKLASDDLGLWSVARFCLAVCICYCILIQSTWSPYLVKKKKKTCRLTMMEWPEPHLEMREYHRDLEVKIPQNNLQNHFQGKEIGVQ